MLLLGFCLFSKLNAQSGWVAPVPGNYSLTANVVAKGSIDGIFLNSNSDQIAFFYNGEIRGLASGTTIPNLGTVFFITLYSNTSGLTLTSKVFKASTNQIYDAETTITFTPQSVSGSPVNPFHVVAFANNDAPINLLQIPPQTTMQGQAFATIPLNDYLEQTDNDPILWSTNANANLIVNIQNDSLFVTGISGFTGQSTLRIKATEQTANQYADSVDVVFGVTAMLRKPHWVTHPSQGTTVSLPFQPANLFEYENEYDGNCLTFDYVPILTEAIPPQPSPIWVAITNLQSNMNITSQIRYTPNFYFNNSNNKLVAFINNQVRGIASGVMQNDQIYFFLTVNNSNTSDTITFKFYSDELKQVVDLDYKIVFTAGGVIGSPQNPFIMELSPLTPVISSSGILNIQKNKVSWTGEQSFLMIAQDCNYSEQLNDTIVSNYCVSASANDLAMYFKDYDDDNYADTFSIQYCSQPIGYKLQNQLINAEIDCNDDIQSININPAITLNDRCYPTIHSAIEVAVTGDTIFIHKDVETTENNILPPGISIKVLANAIWTNNAILINRGKILILGNVHFVNGTAGVYKGKGILSGSFKNYGRLSPGQ